MALHKTMIEEIEREIEEDRANLNEWESEFVESLKKILSSGKELTERQESKLDEIYRRIMG
jgi:transposase-like protein